MVTAFSETAGEVIVAYDAGKDFTRVMLDVSGDAVADLVLRVDGQLDPSGLVL